MNLKQALLAVLEAEQLKELCAELELDADRRSPDDMAAALSGAKRAKPELLIVKLTVPQLRAALQLFEEPTDGRKEELVQRLLMAGGRALAGLKQLHDDLTSRHRARVRRNRFGSRIPPSRPGRATPRGWGAGSVPGEEAA